jgi:hypothetical protein
MGSSLEDAEIFQVSSCTQKLQVNNKPSHHTFMQETLMRLDDDNAVLKYTVFSKKATFPVSGKVNKHNCQIWECKTHTSS